MTAQCDALDVLPVDILHLVFTYLDVKSFLALCSTCKALHQPAIRLDAAYWSRATRSALRGFDQPVVQNDGDYWHRLHRRLRTQCKIYTWGYEANCRLGHGLPSNTHSICHLPTELLGTERLGAIADVQCGKWSTTLLTRGGSLHTVGVLDGQRVHDTNKSLQTLRFPAGYPPSSFKARYIEPSVTIRQFSAGPSHILALSEDGRIWSWYNAKKPALQIKFVNLDLHTYSNPSTSGGMPRRGQVREVVAGESSSSAYIHGVGIVIWTPVERDEDEDEYDETDTMLVVQHTQVPLTPVEQISYTAGPEKLPIYGNEDLGNIVSYILVGKFVVLSNDTGKVFCSYISEKLWSKWPLELRQLRNPNGTPVQLQSGPRKFAALHSGNVFQVDDGYLKVCWNFQTTEPLPELEVVLGQFISPHHEPAISVALGRDHVLSLSSNGTLFSRGLERANCGASGLGDDQEGGSGQARGRRRVSYHPDRSYMLPTADCRGRQVWFDERKTQWLKHVMGGGVDEEESRERRARFIQFSQIQTQYCEWFEQEGRAWDQDMGEDGLGAFFTLAVSAGPRHSAAIVLVNEELIGKEPSYDWKERGFPRLQLCDGTVMPGKASIDQWRERPPDSSIRWFDQLA